MMNVATRCIFYILTITTVFYSCKTKSGLKKISPAKKSGYTIPTPEPVSAKEKARIARGCELFFDTVLLTSNFNGGMLVAKGGSIVYEKYHGSVNLDGKEPMDSSTALHIASVSKTFTAMTILKLQEAGLLDVNDLLSKFFPRFNYPGITLKTLLDHRSGLPNYLYFMEDGGWDKKIVIENKDVLDWLINKKGLIKNIGVANRGFSYSNTNYALLALVIEKISGKSYPQYLKETVFDPLGMKNTFVHHHGDSMIRSKTFDWRGGEIPDNFLDAVYGDKNIYSTPRDILRWDRALSLQLFLSQKSLDSAYEPQSNERPGINNYGLGWRMKIYPDGKKIIYHNGWWHGNNSAFIRLLKDDVTIILISNRYARSVYKAKYLVNLFDHYFDSDVEETESPISIAFGDSTGGKKGAAPIKRGKR